MFSHLKEGLTAAVKIISYILCCSVNSSLNKVYVCVYACVYVCMYVSHEYIFYPYHIYVSGIFH